MGGEGAETATKQETRFNMRVDDARQSKDAAQQFALSERLRSDNVDLALVQAHKFLGGYGGINPQELSIQLVDGKIGEGTIKGKVIEIQQPGREQAISETRGFIEPLLLKDIKDENIDKVAEELATALAVSTALHEGVHGMLDSRPGSKFASDFEAVTGFPNEQGKASTLLDEGIAYAIQGIYAPDVEPIGSLAPVARETDEREVRQRKVLGEKLKPMVQEYLDESKSIDADFFDRAEQLIVETEGDDVDIESQERSVASEIDESVDAVKKSLFEALTSEGLVPEIGERGKDEGFNSEMLGYALRIAVETGDEDLFRRLKKGADFMKMDNGLYRARLDKDKNPDISQGSTWADANQDIALALIEAGEVWSDDGLTQEGVEVAKSFLNAQVVESGDLLVPLQNTVEEEEANVGDRLRRVNPSMYNFKLYEKMAGLDTDNRGRWITLNESGIRLVDTCLDTYRLPPNTLNLVDGKMVTNEELVRGVKGGSYTEVVSSGLLEKVKSIPEDSEGARSIWGFDSMRIPFRLNDSESEEARKMSSIIGEQLDALGGIKTKYYAIDGREHSDGMDAAVVEASLAVSTANKLGSKEAAVKKIKDSVTEIDEQVLYWQLWRGMGLVQLRDYEGVK